MSTSMHPRSSNAQSALAAGRVRYPTGGENSVETQQALHPNSSIEHYNRVMLEYTQRRMYTFMDVEDATIPLGSRSSRSTSGNSSSNSSVSTSGMLGRQAAGPTSAGIPHHCSEGADRKSGTEVGSSKGL